MQQTLSGAQAAGTSTSAPSQQGVVPPSTTTQDVSQPPANAPLTVGAVAGKAAVAVVQKAGIAVDQVTMHYWTFPIMAALVFLVAYWKIFEALNKTIPSFRALLNFPFFSYLVLVSLMQFLTTAFALGFVGTSSLFPPSTVAVAGALFGVLGFEALFNKLVVAFGDIKIDFATYLQGFLNMASSTTNSRQKAIEYAEAQKAAALAAAAPVAAPVVVIPPAPPAAPPSTDDDDDS